MEVLDIPHSIDLEEQKNVLKRRYKIDRKSPSGISNHKGEPIGYKRRDGYYLLSYGGNHVLAHRAVYILTYGAIKTGYVIDHIDRNPSNNLIENLREVTQKVNSNNSKVRIDNNTGERYIKVNTNGTYSVRVKRVTLGTFKTLQEAVDIRDNYLMTLTK